MCWYDHCPIWSGPEQPLTGWSDVSAWPFPPLVWWSPQPCHHLIQCLLTFALHLLGSYHELGIWCARGTVEVLDSHGYAFVLNGRDNPWGIVRPPRLSSFWGTGVEFDLQSLPPCGKGGNLFITPLAHLVKILHKNIEQGYPAKDDWQFAQYMGNASGVYHVPSHICHSPLQWLDDTFLEHCLWVVILDAHDLMEPLLKRYLSLSRSGITTEGIVSGGAQPQHAMNMLRSWLTFASAWGG